MMNPQLVNPNISIVQQIINWDLQIPIEAWEFLRNGCAWLNLLVGDGVLGVMLTTVFTIWLTVVGFRVLVFIWKLLPLT